MKSRPTIEHPRGQILILTALSLFMLIGLAALTIDLGMAYAVKAKLNSAVDAASLAAGKAVKIGTSDATRRQNATNAANTFFAANFPTGVRSTTGTSFSVNNITFVDGTWTINVSASTTAPTFFGSIFNSPIIVGASAQATVKTLDMMLVLDCSGSLGSDFPALKSAAVNFLSGFQEGAGGDRIGLVTFASGAVLNDAINKNFTRGFVKSTLASHINAIATAEGATNAEEAMRIAKSELDAIPANIRSTLRAIVFFSDGAPNIVSGTFKLRDSAGHASISPAVGLYSVEWSGAPSPYLYFPISQRAGAQAEYTYTSGGQTWSRVTKLPLNDYTGTVALAGRRGLTPASPVEADYPYANSWCNLNKASRNMVETLANAARGETGTTAITVYTIGLGSMLRSNEVTNCAYGSSEYGENILKRLANTTDVDTYDASQPTGLYVYASSASQLNAAFQRIRSAVLRLSQ
jgi:Flp pilus assembly protein TadG